MSARAFSPGIALIPQSADPTGPVEGQLQRSDGTARAAGIWQYLSSAWVLLSSAAPGLANKTANFNVLGEVGGYTVDTGSGSVTATLPAIATSQGLRVFFKKTAAANKVIIDGNSSETIQGLTQIELTGDESAVELICGTTEWKVLSEKHTDFKQAVITLSVATNNLTFIDIVGASIALTVGRWEIGFDVMGILEGSTPVLFSGSYRVTDSTPVLIGPSNIVTSATANDAFLHSFPSSPSQTFEYFINSDDTVKGQYKCDNADTTGNRISAGTALRARKISCF